MHTDTRSVLASMGYVLMAYRVELPIYLTINSAQFLFLSSGLIRVVGVKQFFRRRVTGCLLVLLTIFIIVHTSIVWSFTYVVDSIVLRTVFVGTVLACISLYIGILILKNKTKQESHAYNLTASLFFLFTFLFMARLVAWIFFPSVRGHYNASFINDIQLTANMMIDIAWTTMFFVIHNQRVTHRSKENEALLDALFLTNPIPTGIIDLETFRYIRINPCMSDTLEYSIDEFREKKPSEMGIIDEATASIIIEALETKGHLQHFETTVTTKSGKKRHIIFFADFTVQQDKKYVYTTFIDVTEQKIVEEKLKKSEQSLELFFSKSAIGFFFMMLDEPVEWDETTDKDQTLEYVFTHQRLTKVNKAMLGYYKAKEEHFLGLTPMDFYGEEPEERKAYWKRLFDEGMLHVETTEPRFDGTFVTVSGDYICMRDYQNRIIGHFGVMTDVTAAREAQKALELKNIELQKLNVTKDKLFSIIAHDLRDPVGTMKSYLDFISEEEDLSDEDIQRAIGLQKELTSNAYYLLENLLSWAKNNLNQIQVQPELIDLNETIKGNVLLVKYIASNKRIDVSYELPKPYTVFADLNLVNLIFRNLLNNAIKFTPEGGSIIIALFETPDKTGVKITDSGVGIDQKTIDRLFSETEFYTSYGTNREKGTGIGLKLVKNAVELNGGSLLIESELNKGSCFTFLLPKSRG